MVKKWGVCMQMFEPFAEKRAKEETLSFRTIMGEDMPEKITSILPFLLSL